jgi:hypothetical protein
MLKKILACLVILQGSTYFCTAQQNRLSAEFGLAAGSAFYFGDLNNRSQLNRPKPAFSASFRKAFGNYLGARVSASYAQVGYSDTYSRNDYQRTRNLSFNSTILEIAAQADFHFFKFNPAENKKAFTPYLTLGLGLFSFDPYAYYRGKKIFLRPLNTEGQGSTLYPDRKPYNTFALAVPFGLGVKYCINDKYSLFAEVNYRFTNTDYLDDVSKTYAGAAAFPLGADGLPTEAFIMQDRSGELGVVPIGVAGKQRGWSKQKDSYMFTQVGISFNFMQYNCPSY